MLIHTCSQFAQPIADNQYLFLMKSYFKICVTLSHIFIFGIIPLKYDKLRIDRYYFQL